MARRQGEMCIYMLKVRWYVGCDGYVHHCLSFMCWHSKRLILLFCWTVVNYDSDFSQVLHALSFWL